MAYASGRSSGYAMLVGANLVGDEGVSICSNIFNLLYDFHDFPCISMYFIRHFMIFHISPRC